MADTPGRRRRRLSLRTRITALATAAVGVALILGAVAFGLLLRASLIDQLHSAISVQASAVADRWDGFGDRGASGSGESESDDESSDFGDGLALGDVDETFVQVQTRGGVVVASTDDIADAEALVPPEGSDYWTVSLDGDDEKFEATSMEVDDVVVIAAQSVDSVDEAVGTVSALLAVAVPLLILLVALTTFVVVGRALRPVELMRREVDAIGGANLDRRLAEPGARDEIGRLAATMNAMLERLENAQRSQRRFVSDASHELRSPLASLRQYAEVARAHPERISADELTEAILDEGGRLERLVHGMLLLARADETALGLSAHAVDLDDLVLSAARRLRDSSDVSVDTSGVGPARIDGDEGMLGQVVQNLIDNAARHARAHVRVQLSEREPSTASAAISPLVILAVEDDGKGIAPEQRERVFERFVRLDDARARDAGGSGLGLAIVSEIVAAHGGSVTAGPSDLGGARFEVRLPTPIDTAP